MAYRQMINGPSRFDDDGPEYVEFDEVIAVAGAGTWWIVPRGMESVMVSIRPVTAGSGYLEYTLDNYEEVTEGTPSAKTWDAGTVAVQTDDVLHPVTAIRLVNVSGSMRMVGRTVGRPL